MPTSIDAETLASACSAPLAPAIVREAARCRPSSVSAFRRSNSAFPGQLTERLNPGGAWKLACLLHPVTGEFGWRKDSRLYSPSTSGPLLRFLSLNDQEETICCHCSRLRHHCFGAGLSAVGTYPKALQRYQ